MQEKVYTYQDIPPEINDKTFNPKYMSERIQLSEDKLTASSLRNTTISFFGYAGIGDYKSHGILTIKFLIEGGDREICIGGCDNINNVNDPFLSEGMFMYQMEEGSIYFNEEEIAKEIYKCDTSKDACVEMIINCDNGTVKYILNDDKHFIISGISLPIIPLITFYSKYPQKIKIIN